MADPAVDQHVVVRPGRGRCGDERTRCDLHSTLSEALGEEVKIKLDQGLADVEAQDRRRDDPLYRRGANARYTGAWPKGRPLHIPLCPGWWSCGAEQSRWSRPSGSRSPVS